MPAYVGKPIPEPVSAGMEIWRMLEIAKTCIYIYIYIQIHINMLAQVEHVDKVICVFF